MTSPADDQWLAAADAVAAEFTVSRWPERVRGWLDGEGVGTGPWCVALSGGADSVALLLSLVGMMRREPPMNWKLVALHFNHRLRGAAADGDESFCRDLCVAPGVEFRVGRADWPEGSEVSEAQAREARFGFFRTAMAELGSRVLWLGHQRDDVVETMLMRLGRGSGSRGLAAPRPVQRLVDGTVRLRPLLDVARAEIESVLRASGATWRKDASNHGDAYFRNRLRNRVVPAWREAAPADLDGAVARSRALLEEEDDALERWVDSVLPNVGHGRLALAALRTVPVAVTRRALHRWLLAQAVDGELSRDAFEALLASVREGGVARVSIGSGFLAIEADELSFAAGEAEIPDWPAGALPVPGDVTLATGDRVVAEEVEITGELRARIVAGVFDDGRTVFLAAGETPASFLLRPWRAGDRYRPLGAAGTSKLQDQFVNRRIPRDLRRRLPVVCDAAGAILWVPGLPPAHQSRLREGTTRAVQLTYTPLDSLCASSHGR